MPKVRIDPRELPERQLEARRRALHVLSLMREEDESLTGASMKVGTDPRTVRKYVGRALEQDRKGTHYEPKPWDRFIRLMEFPTPKGKEVLPVKDSRSAQRIARYWTAIDKFASNRAGPEVLKSFRGKNVTVNGEEHEFVTDPDMVKRLALAGEFAFENVYARVR